MYAFTVLKTRKLLKKTHNPSRIQYLDFDSPGDFLKYWKKQMDEFVILNVFRKPGIRVISSGQKKSKYGISICWVFRGNVA